MEQNKEKNNLEDASFPNTENQGKSFGLNIVEENDKKIIWLSVVIFIIALVAIIFFVFKYYERYQLVQKINEPDQKINNSLTIQKKIPSELEGEIFLTLAPKNDAGNTVGIYSYDLKREKLEEYLVKEGEKLIGGEAVSFTIGDYISVTDGDSLFVNSVEGTDGWGTLLADGIKNFKSAPVWTNGGWNAVYSALGDRLLDINIPNNWKIYSVKTDAEKPEGKYLTDGIHPRVTRDDYIIFLKDDGLYMMDILGENITKIWEISNARSSMHLDVSRINDLGVLSNPTEGKVYILKMGIKDGLFEGDFIKEINTYARWTTLSPDDKFLAVVEYERDSESSLTNPKLIIYDLETYEKYTIIDLNDYRREEIRISDWRK